MKKLKTRNEYFASNVRYYTDKKLATSYGHWVFVKVINGKTVFNNYTYSSTTSRHQHKVASLMRELGHKIDVYVEISSSLSEESFKSEALYYLYDENVKLIVKNNTKRTTKKTIEKNLNIIESNKNKIEELRELGAKFSMKQIVRLYRRYRKEQLMKEKALKFYKNNKNKFFTDSRKTNYLLVENSINQESFKLKDLNGNYIFTTNWYYFFNNYIENKLMTAIN